MSDSNDAYIELEKLYGYFKANFKQIEDCRLANMRLHERIKQLESIVRQQPISFENIERTIDNGGKCFICAHKSRVVCQVCLKSNSPSGYCDIHRGKHMIEFAQHNAIYRIVQDDKTRYTRKIVLSPERELTQLEARIAELRSNLQ